MKKLSVLSALLAAALLLSACAPKETAEALYGTYTAEETFETSGFTEPLTNEILPQYGFDPMELAFADPQAFALCRVATFEKDGTYTVTYDASASAPLLRRGLDKLFTDLYQNREKLSPLYGTVPPSALESPETLRQYFGVTVFGCASAEDYTEILVQAILDSCITSDDDQTGTFRFEDGKLYLNDNTDGLKVRDGSFTVDGVTFAKNRKRLHAVSERQISDRFAILRSK